MSTLQSALTGHAFTVPPSVPPLPSTSPVQLNANYAAELAGKDAQLRGVAAQSDAQLQAQQTLHDKQIAELNLQTFSLQIQLQQVQQQHEQFSHVLQPLHGACGA